MKYIYLSIAFLFFLTSSAQKVELTGGVNSNNFIKVNSKNSSFTYDYNENYSYNAGIGIDLMIDSVKVRFTLGYLQYSGHFVADDFTRFTSQTMDATVQTSLLDIGMYPINYYLFDRLDINFGFGFSCMMHEDLNGWIYKTDFTENTSEIIDINDEFKRMSARFNFGFRGRVAFDINISETWAISPQYIFQYTFSTEYGGLLSEVRSLRQSFNLGLQKSF